MIKRSGVWFPLLVAHRSVEKTSHSILPLATRHWWVPCGRNYVWVAQGICIVLWHTLCILPGEMRFLKCVSYTREGNGRLNRVKINKGCIFTVFIGTSGNQTNNSWSRVCHLLHSVIWSSFWAEVIQFPTEPILIWKLSGVLGYNRFPVTKATHFMWLAHRFYSISLDHVKPYKWKYTIHMYSGITSGRVLDGELLYTKILEVNLGGAPLSGEKSLWNSL